MQKAIGEGYLGCPRTEIRAAGDRRGLAGLPEQRDPSTRRQETASRAARAEIRAAGDRRGLAGLPEQRSEQQATGDG